MSTPTTLEDYGTAFGHNTHAHLLSRNNGAGPALDAAVGITGTPESSPALESLSETLEVAAPTLGASSVPAVADLGQIAAGPEGTPAAVESNAPTLGAESVTDAQSPEATADASPVSLEDVPPASETPGETPAEQLSEEQYTDASRRVAVILARCEDTPANRRWAWLRALTGVGVKDAAGLAAKFSE